MQTRQQHDRLEDCDLVMKGGITSGIIYPSMISRLSTRYRFKSIGGSSAGAIAAAACAAAEFGRRNGNPEAFDKLRNLPDELGHRSGAGSKSMLFQIFQPSARLEKHFTVLGIVLSVDDYAAASGAVIAGLVKQYWIYSLAIFLLSALLITSHANTTASAGVASAFVMGLGLTAINIAIAVAILRPRLGAGRIVAALAAMSGATGLVTLLFTETSMGKALTIALTTAITVALLLLFNAGVIVWRFAVTLLAGLQDNFYGICNGRTTPGTNRTPGLTDWLTGYLNRLAGLADDAPPLTFMDLKSGCRETIDPGNASVAGLRASSERTAPAINLRVMTTAVTQNMAYSIPFRDMSPEFYYDPAEWEKLFPASVMDWLHQQSCSDPADEVSRNIVSKDHAMLRKLPSGDMLPVVVAVRMSLSFPVLISAVPLYAIDDTDKRKALSTEALTSKTGYQHDSRHDETEAEARVGDKAAPEVAKKIWFSDGGITSNMPLHFFDMPLPRHPTFAVTLKGRDQHNETIDAFNACNQANARVNLPMNNDEGLLSYWKDPDNRSLAGPLSFLWSIVTTMQNWRDEIQLPYPGFRDRVAKINLLPGEGGLNLDMQMDSIRALVDAGDCAASKFIDRFHSSNAHGGWRNHQEIRMGTFLRVLEEIVVHKSISEGHWSEVVESYFNRKHLSDEARRQKIMLAETAIQNLRRIGIDIVNSGESFSPDSPRPRAKFKITPVI